MGFLGPVKNGMIEQLGVALDPRGNVATDGDYMSSVPGVFAAGDMRRGQSLVVWAIAEGSKAAQGIDRFLTGATKLAQVGHALACPFKVRRKSKSREASAPQDCAPQAILHA